jgi:fucose 4-O-acetylase-like acetyltransferase
MDERQQWIDVARGIGIFLVVLGHVNRGLVVAGIVPETNLFLATDHAIYAFHMPLFFLLAGLTIRLQMHKPTQVVVWRLLLIVYAYILWSTVQLILQVNFSHQVNHPASLPDIERSLYQPIGQFWFLYALMICHLIFMLMRGRTSLVIAALIIFTPVQFVDLGIISIAARYFVFYAAGTMFAQQMLSWRPSLTLLAAFIAFFTIGATLNWVRDVDYSSLEALPLACFGIAAVLIASKLIVGLPATVLAVMGRLSLPIFLAHVIAGSGVRAAMVALGVPHIAALYIACGVIAGIGLPMLLYWAAAYLRLLPLLGFAPFDSYLKKAPSRLVAGSR